MKNLKKKLLIGTTIGLACLVLGACTNNQKDGSTEAVSTENNSTEAISKGAESTNVSSVDSSSDANDAPNEATDAASLEATNVEESSSATSASVTKTDGSSTIEKDKAIDSSTVDVSLGDHYDNPPVTDLPDPTVEVR
ncbi:hypothetical protein [Butyrivibrio sp. XBB1001]|uniref:hypothetical protein n=1 Tax=Butyrivibrio sp. XBB1001 TaxID=1280682 RepID=UPI000422E6D7|nr:hypothetical protein [Butyrivibrio sp. XBB1001]